jgi:hypothetical protein
LEPWWATVPVLPKPPVPDNQTVERAATMLQSTEDSHWDWYSKWGHFSLEMISADLWARANLDKENPEILLQLALRFFKFLSGEERQKFARRCGQAISVMRQQVQSRSSTKIR